jgi:cytochrome c55X
VWLRRLCRRAVSRGRAVFGGLTARFGGTGPCLRACIAGGGVARPVRCWPRAASLLPVVLLLMAAADGPPSQRQSDLLYLLRQDCGSCHGMTLKGGLGPPLLPSTLADKPLDVLTDAILRGRPGTPMPPWAIEISADEAAWLARILRDGETHAP